MKKLIAILLAGILSASLLTACSIGKCDVCGKTGILREKDTILGSFDVCSKCD